MRRPTTRCPVSTAFRLFWLYLPEAPGIRAQSIQVVHSAHAMARAGHAVVLCVRASAPDATPATVLGFYGLQPHPGLELVVLPQARTLASIQFRARFVRWCAQGGGVAIARSKRYAAEAARWCGSAFTLVLEAHEVDSVQAAERGEEPSAYADLEGTVLRRSVGVVCNCEGTEALLRATWSDCPPTRAIHNATHTERVRRPEGAGEGLVYAGSLLGVKAPHALADAARALQEPVRVLGHAPDASLVERSQGWLQGSPAVAHVDVPDQLVQAEMLLLPVGGGLFGTRLTSPLKLWDYLAVGRPIVAADTPAIRDAADGVPRWFTPGDGASLAEAIAAVRADAKWRSEAPLRAAGRLRTWDHRAAELGAFLAQVAP